jgi:acetyltransferase-like isoleucine patch superfamily enzyme
MRIVKYIYRLMGKPVPYYADYPLRLIVWKPIRKFFNVVIIPNVVSARLRVVMYRILGFKIGKNVFIGMKCYMDDVEPSKTIIEDDVTISYGTYFAVHGRGQRHTTIRVKKNAYIGMRCNILSGEEGVTIGENAVIGAGSLVNKSVPDNAVAVGCPIKVLRVNADAVS